MNKKKQEVIKYTCVKCEKEKSEGNFYTNTNPLITSDKTIICKSCLSEYIGDKDSSTRLNRVITVLAVLNKPFLSDIWESREGDWGSYIRQVSSLPQHKDLTYKDSDFFKSGVIKEIKINELNNNSNDDLIIKWGSGYDDISLIQLESFYNDMLRANDIQTPQHKAQLLLLCKLHVAQNKALAEERYGDFQKINTQYNKTLENSGFRPIDRQGGGESSGIRTFSQIWEEIEKDGFIKPTPIEENQDIVDRTIMYMSNYTRKLLNMQSLSEPQDDTPKVDDNG